MAHGGRQDQRSCGDVCKNCSMLRLFTRYAIFAQRLLVAPICGHGRDYLLQVKDNQGDILEALQKLLCPRRSESAGCVLG